MRRGIITTLLSVFVSLFAISCGGSESNKGPESEMPVEGSTDSWRTPTDHGELIFGLPSAAELADGALYHAWGFTLSGPADLQIDVTPGADNLDTVMYLYRREPGQTTWGSYIARNDDYQGQPWSRIDANLEAGEYRIMVKGYKELIRGAFDLTANCTGQGCGDVTGVCPEEPGDAPSITDFGRGCVDKILALHGEPTTESNFFVNQSDRCDQPSVVRLAWDYYYQYWEGLAGWDDIVYDPDEELSFEINLTVLAGGGARVDVDYGGDEMAMTYVFDADLNVLAEYQHNQSPMVEFYCGGVGEPTFDLPMEDCFYAFMVAYPTSAPADEVTGTADLSDDVQPAALKAVFLQYAAEQGLGTPPASGTTVSYRFVSWPTEMSDAVYQVTITGDGGEETEYLINWDGGSYSYLFYSKSNGVTDFTCDYLN